LTRRLVTVAVALLALASGAAAAPSSAATPARAARGVLGARTTLTWTGATAIRLSVAHATRYQDGDVDLVVRGGTYAFVRLMQPYQPGCPDQYGPRCLTDRVNWIRGIDDKAYASFPEGRRHEAAFGEPPLVAAPYLDVILFTDGRATLTIRTTSLKGTTAYVPAAPVHGRVSLLGVTCVPLDCSTTQGRTNGAAYGGATYDLGGPGWAEAYVMHRIDDNDTMSAASNQVHGVAPCLYPNPNDHHAPADPAAHPFGCTDNRDPDAVKTATWATAAGFASTTNPVSVAVAEDIPWSGAVGKQYIGFQAIGAGAAASHTAAYGIWFRFLS
jgi:hypothetical protein